MNNTDGLTTEQFIEFVRYSSLTFVEKYIEAMEILNGNRPATDKSLVRKVTNKDKKDKQ